MKFLTVLLSLMLASTAVAQTPTSYYGYLPVVLEPLPWTTYFSCYAAQMNATQRQSTATIDRVSCMTAIANATVARSQVLTELPDTPVDEINAKLMDAMTLLNAGDEYRDNADIWMKAAQHAAELSWWITAENSYTTAAERYEEASIRYGLARDAANEALMSCYEILMTVGMP